METSPTTGKIDEALAKAQSQMKPAVFDSKNPHFQSRYASLASIVEPSRPALTANNIAVVQGTSFEEGRVVVSTMLLNSGEWIRDSLSLKMTRDDPQGVGSAITYARRYALASMVGVVSDEDDDAEGTIPRTEAKPKSLKLVKAPASVAPPTATATTVPVASPATKTQNRVAKIRQIFTMSAQLGQSPQDMKKTIGMSVGYGRPIKESSEIKDENLDEIICIYSDKLNSQNAAKEAA